MKRQLQFLFVVLFLAVFAVSCNDDDTSSIDPDRVVRFSTGESVIALEEGGDPYELNVTTSYSFDAPVRVEFEISGDTDAIEILNENGFVTIPAGSTEGVILLQAADDDVFNATPLSAQIQIIGGDSGFGLPDDLDIAYELKTIEVIDNDCDPTLLIPGDRAPWVGDLEAEDVGYGYVPATGRLSEEDCDILIISGNLPNSAAALTPDFNFYLVDGVVTVPKQPYGNNFYEATGTYDVSTGVIDVYYLYTDPSGGLIWDGTNIIQPL